MDTELELVKLRRELAKRTLEVQTAEMDSARSRRINASLKRAIGDIASHVGAMDKEEARSGVRRGHSILREDYEEIAAMLFDVTRRWRI